MKSQKSEVRSQKSDRKKNFRNVIVIVCLLSSVICLLFSAFCPLPVFGSEKWPGVDETVVEKYAKEHGRQAREPLINTDQGDLLLFVFLIGGAVGGFVAGYSWRILMVEKAPPKKEEEGKNG